MATVAPPADQAADLLQKLSIDSQPKSLELPEPTKKAPANQYGSAVPSHAANGQIQPYERSMTPILQDFMDPSMYYLPNGYPSNGYYYGVAGYDGSGGEWEDYSRYVNPDGIDMPSGVYGDNGSLLYHGYGYGPYAPYSPAGSPAPTFGQDGQLYGPQHYQYPTQYFQPVNPNSGPFSSNATAPSKLEVSTSGPAEQAPLPVETANGNSNVRGFRGNNGSAPAKAVQQNPSFNSNNSYGRGALPAGIPASGFQDARYAFDGMQSPISWLDGTLFPDMQPRPVTNSAISSSLHRNNTASRNQNLRPHTHLMGLHHPRPIPAMGPAHGYLNKMYPNKLYGQCGNAFRSALGFGSNGYDSRNNGRAWLGVDNKYKLRGRSNSFSGYGNDNMDGLNELNRGPRAKSTKNQKGFAQVTIAVKGQNGTVTKAEDEKLGAGLEQYNLEDFPEKYNNAKFFIIKSYSEDDVHKSIKYNVWASTPNGNRKLDAAYQEAQEKSGGCPVFLYFSVNTSGQFVGMAEMLGPVDFHKNVEYWQQDKWNGCFPVKWHIVKDVPNSLLKHIILENNENKPVTNSRDTQEVKLEQGLQMIKIFKDYSSKTCILDDFGFYETRQKTIQEKKAKQQQCTKQVWEGKPNDDKANEGTTGDSRLLQTADLPADPINEPAPSIQTNGDAKQVTENSSVPKAGDAPKVAKPVTTLEKRIAQNGVANGC